MIFKVSNIKLKDILNNKINTKTTEKLHFPMIGLIQTLSTRFALAVY